MIRRTKKVIEKNDQKTSSFLPSPSDNYIDIFACKWKPTKANYDRFTKNISKQTSHLGDCSTTIRGEKPTVA